MSLLMCSRPFSVRRRPLWPSGSHRTVGDPRRPGEDAGKFHVVLEGHARASCVDGVDEPIELSAGDIVALPHGHAHSLIDDPSITALIGRRSERRPPQPLEELLACRPRGDNSVLRVLAAAVNRRPS